MNSAATLIASHNIEGMWEGPVQDVGLEAAVAPYLAKALDQDGMYHGKVDGTAPAKHQPVFAPLAGGGYEVLVLGAGATVDTPLHPHDDKHYIEVVWGTDQHDAVLFVKVMGKTASAARADVTAELHAIPFYTAAGGVKLLTIIPYEYCNLHGLWAGESTHLQLPYDAMHHAARDEIRDEM
jgi:desulfoferrodoxin (superoxide reductase-like protein)